jgi:hypothetical protein
MYFEDAKGINVERNGSTSSNNLLAYSYDEKPKPGKKSRPDITYHSIET